MSKPAVVTVQQVAAFIARNPDTEVSTIQKQFAVSYQVARKLVITAYEGKLIDRKEKEGKGVKTYLYFTAKPQETVTVQGSAPSKVFVDVIKDINSITDPQTEEAAKFWLAHINEMTPVEHEKAQLALEERMILLKGQKTASAAPEVDPVAASVAGIASSGDFKSFVDLIAKPVSAVVAEAVLPAITARTTELVVQKVLAELPSQVVIDLINRLRTVEIGPVIDSTKALVTELAKPKKIRVCISGAKSDDEAKLRKAFESEFTLEFVPSDDVSGIVRSAEFADHVMLLTGRPNTETANAFLKSKGITPLLVSGGFKEISDRLTDLYVETSEA